MGRQKKADRVGDISNGETRLVENGNDADTGSFDEVDDDFVVEIVDLGPCDPLEISWPC